MDHMEILVDVANGLAVPEGRIVSCVDEMIKDFKAGKALLAVGAHDIITELRVRVKRREVDVTFTFGDIRISVMSNGRLPIWPKGFPGDHHDGQLMELLD